ncbi:MAG: ABC transporter ATP-binding protein [Coriobacteriales bacterium]|jgi:NitT/TauT family transport system ATP-binding protein|nr:ABC transporter ATP-binding protein [Coriobacteriales bacterium]
MLSFEDIKHTYHGSSGDVEALAGLTLTVEAGEPLALIGPSGCGKSTALLLAAGLLVPTGGSVRVAGRPLAKPRFATGLILQDFGLLPWKTVFANAELGLRIRHLPRADREERTRRTLEQVGLADFARNYPGELSGGMRQRLALARVLALEVDLLLMDEPLSAVDALLREGLQDLLLALWRERGYAQVLVTHSIEEAVFLGRHIAVMAPRPGLVAALIDNPNMGVVDYRSTSEFFATCRAVREALGEAESRVDSGGALQGGKPPQGGEALGVQGKPHQDGGALQAEEAPRSEDEPHAGTSHA